MNDSAVVEGDPQSVDVAGGRHRAERRQEGVQCCLRPAQMRHQRRAGLDGKVFQPVGIGKYHYVDGGVVSPVPVDAARQLGADVVVAVDISSKARGQSPTDMLGTLGQSIAIMGQKLGQAELARADVVVRPRVLDIGPVDFQQRTSAIAEGEKAALAALPQLRQRVAQVQAERAQAVRLAQQKAAEAGRQACLESRSRLRKLAGMAGLDDSCAQP